MSDGSFKPGDLILPALRFNEEEFREKLSRIVTEKGLSEHIFRFFTR